LLAVLVASGMIMVVTRYHFEEKDGDKQSQVWWTGLTFLMITATAIVVPFWLGRETLASLTLGSTIDQGVLYYALILPTFWFGHRCATPKQLPKGPQVVWNFCRD